MRALVQRVSRAAVSTGGRESAIGPGLLILLGVRRGDTREGGAWLAKKCAGLRIFEDRAGKMNRSLVETGGEALVVSQFTLYGDAGRGRRPSFTEAAPPGEAEALYESFVKDLAHEGVRRVATGVFQAMMSVSLVNEGPVTLLLESREGSDPPAPPPVLKSTTPSLHWPHDEPLVLASASPRRAELLARAGIPFEAAPASVSEEEGPGELPREIALALALRKAEAVAARRPGRIVLGADTVVDLDGRSLGKPANRAAARRMLEALAGREHEVHTGIALAGPDGRVRGAVETTRVAFRALRAEEIEAYASSGEPMDKAGGYGIQGGASHFVTRIEGSYDNVMGLPVARLLQLIEEAS